MLLSAYMHAFLRNHRLGIPVGVGVVVLVAWVVFGYFGAHLLFVDDEVNEGVPSFGAVAASIATAPPASPVAPVAAPESTPLVPTEPVPTEPVPTEPTAPVSTAPVSAEPTIVTEATGSFVSRAHDTSGRVLVLGDGGGQRFLRFEDLATSNGPDLNVYLVNSSTGDVTDFVDLGNLAGNVGDQNYEIPVGTDLSVHDTVVIWCVRFSENFGDAFLALP